MPDRVICELCGCTVPPHAHYIVRIDVFADPQMRGLIAEIADGPEPVRGDLALVAQIPLSHIGRARGERHIDVNAGRCGENRTAGKGVAAGICVQAGLGSHAAGSEIDAGKRG